MRRLVCLLLGHRWTPYVETHRTTAGQGYLQAVKRERTCRRCRAGDYWRSLEVSGV